MEVTSLLDNASRLRIFSAICKKPTIVYLVLVYYLLRMNMNMKYENAFITLCYLSVILIFPKRHF